MVAGERVDDVALAAPVCGGDRHELALARGRRERARAGEEPLGVGHEQRGGDEDCSGGVGRDIARTLPIRADTPLTAA